MLGNAKSTLFVMSASPRRQKYYFRQTKCPIQVQNIHLAQIRMCRLVVFGMVGRRTAAGRRSPRTPLPRTPIPCSSPSGSCPSLFSLGLLSFGVHSLGLSLATLPRTPVPHSSHTHSESQKSTTLQKCPKQQGQKQGSLRARRLA